MPPPITITEPIFEVVIITPNVKNPGPEDSALISPLRSAVYF